jgi:hypothetical protein
VKHGLSPAKNLQNLATLQLSANNNLTGYTDGMDLKHRLRDVEANRANLLYGRLLSRGSSKHRNLAHRDAGGGAVHSIKSGL